MQASFLLILVTKKTLIGKKTIDSQDQSILRYQLYGFFYESLAFLNRSKAFFSNFSLILSVLQQSNKARRPGSSPASSAPTPYPPQP